MEVRKETFKKNLFFAFEFTNPNEKVHFYSQGHITIFYENEVLTSSKDSQQMSIFLSISDLLDGLIYFLKSDLKLFEFISDGNFTFKIKRSNKNKIFILTQESKKTNNLIEEQIIYGLRKGLENFEENVSDSIYNEEVLFEDIIYMIKKFRKEFK